MSQPARLALRLSIALLAALPGPATALDPGDIVVIQSTVGEPELRRFDPATSALRPLPGPVVVGEPTALVVGDDGTIYLADRGLQAIVAIDPDTEALSIVSAGGELTVPTTLTLDGRGSAVVANNFASLQNLVRVDLESGAQQRLVDGEGLSELLLAFAGGSLFYTFGSTLFRADPVTGAASEIGRIPSDVTAIEPLGPDSLFAAGSGSGWRVDLETGEATAAPANALSGATDVETAPDGQLVGLIPGEDASIARVDPENSFVGSNLVLTQKLRDPRDLAIGPMGRLHVLDSNRKGALVRIDPENGKRKIKLRRRPWSPTSLGVDGEGRLLVLEQAGERWEITEVDPLTDERRRLGRFPIRDYDIDRYELSAVRLLVSPDGKAFVASSLYDFTLDDDASVTLLPRIEQLDLEAGTSKLLVDGRGLGGLDLLDEDDLVSIDGFGEIETIDRKDGDADEVMQDSMLARASSVLVDRRGRLLVAAAGAQALVRVDLGTEALQVVAKGDAFRNVRGLAFDSDCRVIAHGSSGMFRVDPRTGVATMLTRSTPAGRGAVAVIPAPGVSPRRCKLPSVGGLPELGATVDGSIAETVGDAVGPPRETRFRFAFHADGTWSATSWRRHAWTGTYVQRRQQDGRHFRLFFDAPPFDLPPGESLEAASLKLTIDGDLSKARIKGRIEAATTPSGIPVSLRIDLKGGRGTLEPLAP